MQHHWDRKKMPLRSSALQHRLSLYAVAATAAGVSALALAQPSQAEIVLTPVNIMLGHSGHYAIDLNHDGVTDFLIQNIFSGASSGSIGYFKNRFLVFAAPGAEIMTSGLVDGGYAADLPVGREIGCTRWKPKSALLESTWGNSSGQYDFGNWFRKSNRYLGLQFQIDGQVHYGWVRLTVKNNSPAIMRVHITSFAYETVANQPIRAGQTEEESLSKPESLHAMPSAELGVLALGAPGLSIWRREENEER